MKRYVYSTLAAVVLSFSMVGARTIRDFFISEPGEVFTMLSENARMDMLDYYDAGQHGSAGNNMGGRSSLQKADSAYVSVKMSESSSTEMFLIVNKKDTAIFVISTYMMPAADSQVRVFDCNWAELETEKFFKEPTMSDFIVIPDGKKKKKKDVEAMIEFPIISYSYNPSTMELVAKQNLKDYMTVEGYEDVSPYLADSLVYVLKGKKFSLKKK